MHPLLPKTRSKAHWSVIVLALAAAGPGADAVAQTRLRQPAAITPSAPTGVTVAYDGQAAVVAWQPATNAAAYFVSRTIDPNVAGSPLTPGPVTATTYRDGSVQRGASYHYQVVAVSPTGQQAASAWVAVSVPSLPPIASPVTRTTTRTSAPPPGLPPINLRVIPSTPGTQLVTWDVTAPFTGFKVERQDASASGWHLLTPQPISLKGFQDIAFVPPGATYRISVNYADGTVGSGQTTFLNPTAPTHPTGLTAKQTAEGTVELSWRLVTGATGYQLFGPGQPAGGTLVKAQTFKATGIAPGSYQFNVASVFAAGMWSAPAPSAAVTVRRMTGKYRVWINGFKVYAETRDDLTPSDGQHDEVYVAANTFLYDNRQAYRPSTYSAPMSGVLGDASVQTGRALMGSASPSGGIQTGDVIPNGVDPSAPNRGISGIGKIPLLVWEGGLTSGREFVVIAPSIWQWNGDLTSYNFWNSTWRTALMDGVGLGQNARSALQAPTIDKVIHLVYDVRGQPLSIAAPGANIDRPIGLGMAGVPVFFFHGLVLTQELIERTLEAAGGAKAVVPFRFTDYQGTGSGDYLMYLEIDRTTP